MKAKIRLKMQKNIYILYLCNFSELNTGFFFSTANITHVEGGDIYDKHPPLTTFVW